MGQQISLPVLEDIMEDGVIKFDSDMHHHQLKENGFSEIKVLPWGFSFHLSSVSVGTKYVCSMPVMALRYDAEAYTAIIFFVMNAEVLQKLIAHGGVQFDAT